MKARRKDSNDEWQDIAYVQLVDSYVIQPTDRMEFDTLSTDVKTNTQINEESHWQDVRERAAIAAMQGIISTPNITFTRDSLEIIPHNAILIADELVKQLKKK